MSTLSIAAQVYLGAKQSRQLRLERRRRRFPWVAQVAPVLLRNPPLEMLLPARGRILVVGCGGGHCVASLSGRGRRVVGFDVDRTMVRVAGELRRGVFSLARAEQMPFATASFDAILSDNVVEHVPLAALRAHFREARRVLRPGAPYVMATPHPLCPTAERPGHVTLLDHDGWAGLMEEAGFALVRTPWFCTLRLGALSHKRWIERCYRLLPFRTGYAKLGIKTVRLVAAA